MTKAVLMLSAEALPSAYGEPVLARLRDRIDLLATITPGEAWRRCGRPR